MECRNNVMGELLLLANIGESVEQQLKALGISQKPDELERAESAIKLFDAEVPDAAKKLGY